MNTNENIIAQTKKWITDVVVGCNFCPFAGREVKRGSIFYEVNDSANKQEVLEKFASMLQQLDEDNSIETSLLILPSGFQDFENYLSLLELTEKIIEQEDYEGVYQVASFHPGYMFAGSNEEDPSNYTNRSPYPMLHLLREASVTRAIESHPAINSVPEDNIAFTREKGLRYMQQLLAACMN